MKKALTTMYNRIEIWSPRYKDAKDLGSYVVLIAKYKVADNNIIWFSKAKHLADAEYYISGATVRQFPIDSNGKIDCYAVPLNDMERVTDTTDDSWDKLLEEYDELEKKSKKRNTTPRTDKDEV